MEHDWEILELDGGTDALSEDDGDVPIVTFHGDWESVAQSVSEEITVDRLTVEQHGDETYISLGASSLLQSVSGIQAETQTLPPATSSASTSTDETQTAEAGVGAVQETTEMGVGGSASDADENEDEETAENGQEVSDELLRFKFDYQGDKRRIAVSLQELVFGEVCARVAALYRLNNVQASRMHFEYADEDGDVCKITSDAELVESVRHQRELGQSPLRFSVCVGTGSITVCIGSSAGTQTTGVEVEVVEQVAMEDSATNTEAEEVATAAAGDDASTQTEEEEGKQTEETGVGTGLALCVELDQGAQTDDTNGNEESEAQRKAAATKLARNGTVVRHGSNVVMAKTNKSVVIRCGSTVVITGGCQVRVSSPKTSNGSGSSSSSSSGGTKAKAGVQIKRTHQGQSVVIPKRL